MKRFKILGLCLVAVFAFSALASVTVAQAGEYGQCQAKKKGNYTESSCNTMGQKKGHNVLHKGTYEWTPGTSPACVPHKKGNYTESACLTMGQKKGKNALHKGSYEKEACFPNCNLSTNSSGAGALKTPAAGAEVVCTASTGAAEVTGVKTSTLETTFTGCSLFGAPCESVAPYGNPSGESGVIKTNPLKAVLVDYPEKLGQIDEAKVVAFITGKIETVEPYKAQFQTWYAEWEIYKVISEAEFLVKMKKLGEEYLSANTLEVLSYPGNYDLVGPGPGAVWNDIEGNGSPVTAAFECPALGPVWLRTTGTLAGIITAGVNTTGGAFTTTFAEGTGVNNLGTEVSTDGQVTFGPPGISNENLVAASISNDPTSEIKS